MPAPAKRGYHHGNLRTELLDRAAALIAEEGPHGVTLRGLAAAAGVSHAAPAHHFGDRAGLFTALAVQGFHDLAGALATAGGDLAEQLPAYVAWAAAHPGHYAVMFDRSLVHADDPEFAAAIAAAGEVLTHGSEQLDLPDVDAVRLTAFSVAHGLASLRANGALPERYAAGGPEQWARRMTAVMFGALSA